MRRTLGTAVFAGMIGVTLFGIFLTPVFFYVIRRFSGSRTPSYEPATKKTTANVVPLDDRRFLTQANPFAAHRFRTF